MTRLRNSHFGSFDSFSQRNLRPVVVKPTRTTNLINMKKFRSILTQRRGEEKKRSHEKHFYNDSPLPNASRHSHDSTNNSRLLYHNLQRHNSYACACACSLAICSRATTRSRLLCSRSQRNTRIHTAESRKQARAISIIVRYCQLPDGRSRALEA